MIRHMFKRSPTSKISHQLVKSLNPRPSFSGIFSSAWLCPQSSWNRNSSVRPCRTYLCSQCTGFFQRWLLLPLGHTLETFFLHFRISFSFFGRGGGCYEYRYFSSSLTWYPMGAKISIRYSYRSQPKIFTLLLNFWFPMVLKKNYVWDFWHFEIEILTMLFSFSLTWDLFVAGCASRKIISRNPFPCTLESYKYMYCRNRNPGCWVMGDLVSVNRATPRGHEADAFPHLWVLSALTATLQNIFRSFRANILA